jgi:hypothetical protein
MNILDRYRGAVLGLAAGDALGTLKFTPPGSFGPIDDMVGRSAQERAQPRVAQHDTSAHE